MLLRDAMEDKRTALIIATGHYEDPDLLDLDGPSEDARQLERALADTSIGGFDVQVAQDLRVDELRRRIEAFFAGRTRDELVFVHFSGHGLKDSDGRLYLAAADTDRKLLLSTAIHSDWFQHAMDRCRSKRMVLVLDCCYGGAFASGMRHRGNDAVEIKERFGGHGRVVLTASSALEYAFEGDQRVGDPQPSVFTKALVNGLETGAADADQDSRISVDELYEYVEKNLKEQNASQTPGKFGGVQGGPLFIAESTYVAPVKPKPLQKALRLAIESDVSHARLGAAHELKEVVARAKGKDPGLLASAAAALKQLADDDSRSVSTAAVEVLKSIYGEGAPGADRTGTPPGQAEQFASGTFADDDHATTAGWVMGAREIARTSPSGDTRFVAMSPDGTRVASGGNNRAVRVWDAADGRPIFALAHGWFTFVRALAFSPDGKSLATGSDDWHVRIWDLVAGEERRRLDHVGVNDVRFDRDGARLATAGDDRTARVWDVASGDQLVRVQHGGAVRIVAFNPAGDLLATGSDDRTARVWAIDGGRELARVAHGTWVGVVRSVVFSPDGTLIASAGDSNAIRIWEPLSGKVVTQLTHEGQFTYVKSISFSRDGRFIASAGDDRTARIWDMGTGAIVAQMRHGAAVNAVAFSANGKYVATASDDASARVWEVATGRQVAEMAHAGPVRTVAFAPTGKRVATASTDQILRVWEFRG